MVGFPVPAMVGDPPVDVRAEKGPLLDEAYPAVPGAVQGEDRYAEAGSLATYASLADSGYVSEPPRYEVAGPSAE